MSETIGLIGLGSMGLPLATNLIESARKFSLISVQQGASVVMHQVPLLSHAFKNIGCDRLSLDPPTTHYLKHSLR